MSIKCWFHGQDLDGWASGAIVKYKFPEAKMFPINYGDKFPWEEINSDDIVYMVDFSLSAEEMDRLNNHLQQNLIWIDHHIGAIREYEDMPMRYFPILGK
jgi:oligoribonuclease NrnB/cAMP/cGMP phosphodiesterase (DHH superfamily)